MKATSCCVLLLLLLAATALANPTTMTSNSDPNLVVQTKYGPVRGLYETAGDFQTRSFRGIRYAAAPTGSRRWQRPEAPSSWASVMDATAFGAGCPQHCVLPPHTCPEKVSEDCLFLNVWTPKNVVPSKPLPVAVWIHGGHFEQGSGEGPFYDSSAAASQGIVVVTINYRLGALGFLATDDIEGSFGLFDQAFALQWVHENVAAFGGNPKNVTIFGQSAGGTSVASLLVSDLVPRGYIQRAVIQSNPWALPIMKEDSGIKLSTRFAKFVGCGDGKTPPNATTTACMRLKTSDQLLAAQKQAGKIFNPKDLLQIFYPWVPSVRHIPDQPLRAVMNGQLVHNVPVVLGTVENEARIFIAQAFPSRKVSWLEYYGFILAKFGLRDAIKVLSVYPRNKETGNNFDVLCQVTNHYVFMCPTRAAARALSMRRGVNDGIGSTFAYRFNHSLSFDGWGANYSYCEGYACHAAELPFVFDISYNDFFQFSQDELQLASTMNQAWGQFMKWGDPDLGNPHSPSGAWEPYNVGDDNYYLFEAPTGRAVRGLEAKYCELWDAVGWSL